MDRIGKGPAILSTCVKRWRFFACKVGFLLQDCTKFGTAGLFRLTEHAKAVLILKTIGNRKGDCAWSCSRWQTQPEKICKSQRTNQCHSLRTLYWFVRCDLQIFSGCVCHLEQLHAQSPFLFPIVFSINLIPFFDICSVDYLLFFHPGCSCMCCFTWAAARSQQLLFVVLAAGILWFTGKSRQAHQRTIMHSTRTLDRLWTRRRVRSTRNGTG